jgi:hypothetical protein
LALWTMVKLRVRGKVRVRVVGKLQLRLRHRCADDGENAEIGPRVDKTITKKYIRNFIIVVLLFFSILNTDRDLRVSKFKLLPAFSRSTLGSRVKRMRDWYWTFNGFC